MAEREETDEVAALEQARAQLEVALSGNAHWIALRGDADEADRRLHEHALANNPLYKSWKLLDEAVESLRSAGGEAEHAADAHQNDFAAPAAAADVVPTAAAQTADDPHPRDREVDLPDILEHIRSGAASNGEPQIVSLFEALAEPDEVDPDQVREASVATNAEPSPAASEDQPDSTPPAVAPQRPSIPTVAASPHMNTDAAERARRLEEERRQLAAKRSGEPDEATVTFVIREPARGAAHAVDVPTPGLVAKGDGREGPYVPPRSQTEEAEVEIVRPDTPAGAVRRFLRTLTGG